MQTTAREEFFADIAIMHPIARHPIATNRAIKENVKKDAREFSRMTTPVLIFGVKSKSIAFKATKKNDTMPNKLAVDATDWNRLRFFCALISSSCWPSNDRISLDNSKSVASFPAVRSKASNSAYFFAKELQIDRASATLAPLACLPAHKYIFFWDRFKKATMSVG